MGLKLGTNVLDKIRKMYDNNPPKNPPNEFWKEDGLEHGWEDPNDHSSLLWDSYSGGLTSGGKRTLNSLLEKLDGIMQSGDMDDHISSIRSGNPTDEVRDWMSGFTDYDFDIQDSMYTDNPMMDNDYAKNLESLLNEYRENWLGYHQDEILKTTGSLTDYNSVLNNRPIIQP